MILEILRYQRQNTFSHTVNALKMLRQFIYVIYFFESNLLVVYLLASFYLLICRTIIFGEGIPGSKSKKSSLLTKFRVQHSFILFYTWWLEWSLLWSSCQMTTMIGLSFSRDIGELHNKTSGLLSSGATVQFNQRDFSRQLLV